MKTLLIVLFITTSIFAQQMSKEEFQDKLRDRIKINRAEFERCLVRYMNETEQLIVKLQSEEKKLNSDEIFDATMSLINEYEEYCKNNNEPFSYLRFKEFVNNAR